MCRIFTVMTFIKILPGMSEASTASKKPFVSASERHTLWTHLKTHKYLNGILKNKDSFCLEGPRKGVILAWASENTREIASHRDGVVDGTLGAQL